MSNNNYKIIVEEITKFLEEYRKIILEEHHEELLRTIVFFKQFVNVTCKISNHGCHFKNCPWSSNLCRDGPDTCACYMLDNKLVRIKKLMALYKKIVIKNK